jgi:hypothetical protein
LAEYIPAVRKLARQGDHITFPPIADIQRAFHILSKPVVAGYPPFTKAEVRVIAAYRAYLKVGGFEFVWPSIVAGDWTAWLLAIHEAAELQAFADLDANPFVYTVWERNWQEPHIRAVLAELRYLRGWAQQMGIETSENALEATNPIRGLLQDDHLDFMQVLEARTGWSAAAENESQTARRFWQEIRSGNNP